MNRKDLERVRKTLSALSPLRLKVRDLVREAGPGAASLEVERLKEDLDEAFYALIRAEAEVAKIMRESEE